MIDKEPAIDVGVLDRCPKVSGRLDGRWLVNGVPVTGVFHAWAEGGEIHFSDSAGKKPARGETVFCTTEENGSFALFDVTIGVRFHWEREEEQVFRGSLALLARKDDTITAINRIGLEDYLTSVISSEINPLAPTELLKAHAVTSRSWLAALLTHKSELLRPAGSEIGLHQPGKFICWYNHKDHDLFDVCADDHCQRYQGVAKVLPETTGRAVQETRGLFLMYKDKICDARYHKACGGWTENFRNVWEEADVPYLSAVADAAHPASPVQSEKEARRWVLSDPDAYCNVKDRNLLQQALTTFDQETKDFFRWKVEYQREDLESILKEKSGFDFGRLDNMVPIERGPSGRIVQLKIEGSKTTQIVGKELEIRRRLSRTHLLSSAFVVDVERDAFGNVSRFVLHGAGWGHGVGLCQIGAASMAAKGFSAEEILRHYFRGTQLKKLY
jgi:SpoIID/LytB domain protein